MSGKTQRPPEGEPFVWQTRELRASDAWRSAGINARRFVDFLLIEHMNHGGRENGRLKAPHRQLEAFGIPARYIADAIREAEELGLVDCQRGGMRVATTYSITWLPSHDGAPATNCWRAYHNPNLAPLSQPKNQRQACPTKGRQIEESALQREGRSSEKSALQREGAF